MRALRLLVVQSLIAIVTITIAPAYCRGDVVYQADFEEPSFTPGLLDGQDEWRTKFGIDAAMITDVQPRAGVQSIQMDGEAAMPNGGLVGTVSELLLNYDPVVNNFPIINIRVDVRLDGPSTDTGGGPADDLLSANLMARTIGDRLIAGMLVSSSGEVWSGVFGNVYQIEAPVDLGQYHNLRLRLDYAEQESEFFLNGNSLGVISFHPSMPAPVLSAVWLELQALDNPATIDPGEYTAYFDNLIITVGDVQQVTSTAAATSTSPTSSFSRPTSAKPLERQSRCPSPRARRCSVLAVSY